jgi:hypothetical protein
MIHNSPGGVSVIGKESSASFRGVIDSESVQRADIHVIAGEIPKALCDDIVPDDEQALNEAAVREPKKEGDDNKIIVA